MGTQAVKGAPPPGTVLKTEYQGFQHNEQHSVKALLSFQIKIWRFTDILSEVPFIVKGYLLIPLCNPSDFWVTLIRLQPHLRYFWSHPIISLIKKSSPMKCSLNSHQLQCGNIMVVWDIKVEVPLFWFISLFPKTTCLFKIHKYSHSYLTWINFLQNFSHF